jgi:dTDP-4-dehydrorhamnose 3,5-epimerase
MGIDSTRPQQLPLVFVPKRHIDDRGWFSETLHLQRLRDLGINHPFVQENQSSSKRASTLRGLHFQRPPAAQAKLVSVVRGRILDVAVDIRRGSPSYGNYVSIELSAAVGEQLYIPTGFAHGFITLEDDVVVMYKTSAYYAPSHEGGICWNDPDIGFSWPYKDTDTIISDKDGRLPRLKDIDSPFPYEGQPLTALTVPKLG